LKLGKEHILKWKGLSYMLTSGLTTSIGISFNKIFSKLGSDMVGKNEIIEITKDNFKSKV